MWRARVDGKRSFLVIAVTAGDLSPPLVGADFLVETSPTVIAPVQIGRAMTASSAVHSDIPVIAVQKHGRRETPAISPGCDRSRTPPGRSRPRQCDMRS